MKLNILLINLSLIILIGCLEEQQETPTSKDLQLNNVDHIAFTKDNGFLISGSSDGNYRVYDKIPFFQYIYH